MFRHWNKNGEAGKSTTFFLSCVYEMKMFQNLGQQKHLLDFECLYLRVLDIL